MTKLKSHYYDGFFYDKFIAPNQDLLFRLIAAMIPENARVLDVGCGTGRLLLQLASKCKEAVGLELSSRNVKTAEKNRVKFGIENVRFLNESLEDFNKRGEGKFDFAITTYVIHEVPEGERLALVQEMRRAANKIILGDYLVPRPKYHYYVNEFIEFIAGAEHYRGFKSFVRNGGLVPLVEQAGLRIIKEIKGKPATTHLILAE